MSSSPTPAWRSARSLRAPRNRDTDRVSSVWTSVGTEAAFTLAAPSRFPPAALPCHRTPLGHPHDAHDTPICPAHAVGRTCEPTQTRTRGTKGGPEHAALQLHRTRSKEVGCPAAHPPTSLIARHLGRRRRRRRPRSRSSRRSRARPHRRGQSPGGRAQYTPATASERMPHPPSHLPVAHYTSTRAGSRSAPTLRATVREERRVCVSVSKFGK